MFLDAIDEDRGCFWRCLNNKMGHAYDKTGEAEPHFNFNIILRFDNSAMNDMADWTKCGRVVVLD
jgi:hypothetical protein